MTSDFFIVKEVKIDMICGKNFSKDPKTVLVSIEEFLRESNYLCEIKKNNLWKSTTVPEPDKTYYKFTEKYLISIFYGKTLTNYGFEIKEKLELIEVAQRDGKTEYELFDRKINEIKNKKEKNWTKKIDKLEKAKKHIPKYKENGEELYSKEFESYLINTGYKTKKETLKNKYLVFDVETNGVRKSNDDLLSLSIYDPSTGICYNRFFPLDLQPLVLTGFIHGITDDDLSCATHMTQEELDWLYKYFHLKDRILLSYSGGKGTFDPSFVQNYCRRQGVQGFEDLQFENIKSRIPQAPFGLEGQLTKDNLCKLFGIDGVSEIHSSLNDCILQWKLFEKIESECVFFIKEHLYKYTPEYIIPYSYLFQNEDLVKYADVKVPDIRGKATELFKLEFPKKVLKDIKKFPTNITGISIEHGINAYLGAKKQNNRAFLSKNRLHLKYVGSLESRIKTVPIIFKDDGMLQAVRKEDREEVDQVNSVTKLVIEHIEPLVLYIKKNIFKKDNIMTQELSISDDKKVLALCDLSDSENVLEIKTYNVLIEDDIILRAIARQLYYQAKGRNTFLLSIKFDTHLNCRTSKQIIDGLNVYLYKVDLFEFDSTTVVHTRTLTEEDKTILKTIIEKPDITMASVSKKLNKPYQSVLKKIKDLEKFGYIKKEYPHIRKSPWKILRNVDDRITKYNIDGENIKIIQEQ